MNTTQHFANYYMTLEEFGLWNYARAVSVHTGVFYMGHAVADQFDDTGKDAIYRVIANLVRKGWVKVLRKSFRNAKTGVIMPTEYYPLTMEEWAAKYPKKLRKLTSPDSGTGTSDTGDTGTSLDSQTGTSRDSDNDQSGNGGSPVWICPDTSLDFQTNTYKENPTTAEPSKEKPTPSGDGNASAVKEEYLKKVQDAFLRTTHKTLNRKDAESIFTDRKPSAVYLSVLRFLDQRERGWDGLNKPASVFLQEFAAWYDPDAMSWEEQQAMIEVVNAEARAAIEQRLKDLRRQKEADAVEEGVA